MILFYYQTYKIHRTIEMSNSKLDIIMESANVPAHTTALSHSLSNIDQGINHD